MAILDSTPIEIQATVAGVLILLIITLFEIINLQRARKLHRQELHAIANGEIPAQKQHLIPLFSLSIQFIFGFAAFALFVWWMMYLIILENPGLAVVAGVSAFIGVITPFIVWSACRKADQETAAAIQAAGQRRQQAARQERTPETPTVQTVAASVIEETVSIPAEIAVIDPSPVAEPRPAAEPQPKVEVEAQPASALYPKPDPAHEQPQDSMLRRHFITHLAAAAKPSAPARSTDSTPSVPTRPTDSMLARHYDAMLAKRTAVDSARPVVTPVTPVAFAAAKSCSSGCSDPVKLPEDSLLRRHFLATFPVKIEAQQPLPERPTDSMLGRHFDAFNEVLLAAG
ncbi:hypothetical protein [Methylomicrobium lacus]|uniref:hypothetical protein n=1 Tax=Methylomicrobium lacus TaxID=136992 RepID=UPI00045E9F37|nr:hypothetical protein [Methylomicrobium lacus]